MGKRKVVTIILKGTNTILVEGDPYGQLRFLGEEKPSFYERCRKQIG